MSDEHRIEERLPESTVELTGADLLRPLVAASTGTRTSRDAAAPAVIGELIAMADGGRVPLVCYAGQPTSAAVRAHSVVDLHGTHIGRRVVLCFEQGDPARPIVLGVLRDRDSSPLSSHAGHLEVASDGDRLIVSAKEQIVLRCGKASITLTRAGKVLIQGDYVVSRSTGVHRIKGGSVQIN